MSDPEREFDHIQAEILYALGEFDIAADTTQEICVFDMDEVAAWMLANRWHLFPDEVKNDIIHSALRQDLLSEMWSWNRSMPRKVERVKPLHPWGEPPAGPWAVIAYKQDVLGVFLGCGGYLDAFLPAERIDSWIAGLTKYLEKNGQPEKREGCEHEGCTRFPRCTRSDTIVLLQLLREDLQRLRGKSKEEITRELAARVAYTKIDLVAKAANLEIDRGSVATQQKLFADDYATDL
jgi:hypothetical protein